MDTKEKVLQDKLSSQLIQEQMFCQRLSEAHNEIEKYQNATISNSDMLGENDKLKEKISLLKDLNSKDSDRINELMNTIEALKKESREKDTWSLIGGPESNMDALIKEENAVLRNDNNNIKDENTSLREEIAEMNEKLNANSASVQTNLGCGRFGHLWLTLKPEVYQTSAFIKIKSL